MVDIKSLQEANIHFALHHAFMNVIEKAKKEGKKFDHIEFDKTKPEYYIKGIGWADLVLFDKKGIPWLLIEVKSSKKVNDPYNPKVIDQALRYAGWINPYYIATCDGQTFVLFDNKEKGVPFWQKKRFPPYDLAKERTLEEFAEKVLHDIVKLELGIKKWQALDEAFVSRLKTLHERFAPLIFESLKSALKKKLGFKKKYEKWLVEQGFPINDETHNKIAVETAYILINKILFYKVLETKYKDLPKLRKMSLLIEKDISSKFRETLERCFKNALNIDYRAVFEPGIYDDIPLSRELIERLNEFLDEAAAYDLSKIESDVIGRIYEGLIPKEERRKLGQYYTPPAICDLIVKMCVNKPDAFVLDPGCGSGGFLIRAYYRLLELKGKKYPDEKTHQEILRQLWGIDISQFPAHLSVINLALRNLKAKSDMINIIPNDFFEIFHRQKRLKPLGKLTIDDIKELRELPPQFDAVVCNPPYTRQEQIGDKKYKDFIRRVALTFDNKQVDMSARAGIYAYFFTHSTHFLKENGMMGYIVSNSWLDVDFGKYLQKFFLDNFKIHSIIEFDRRAFAEAEINTIIIILQKLTGKQNRNRRNNNLIKFVRIKKRLKTEEIIDLIKDAKESYENDSAKVFLKKQRELYEETKWGKYLRAPMIYFKIIASHKILPFNKIAKINRAVTTGANKFFILDKIVAKRWGIEENYLKNCIASPQEVKYIELRKDDVKKYLLMVHQPKSKLKGRRVLEYIKDGERRNYHKRPTTKSRKNWYDLGERKPVPIILPWISWERFFAIWNVAQVFTPHNFYEIIPNNLNDTKIILGILNSSLIALFAELHGRIPLGAGALELMVYEVQNLPILNPNKLTKKEKKMIESAFVKLCKAQRKGDKKSEEQARKELDNVIFDTLKLSKEERQKVYEGLKELRKMRRKRKEVEILVEHPETRKLKKQKKIREFKRKEKPSLEKWFGS